MRADRWHKRGGNGTGMHDAEFFEKEQWKEYLALVPSKKGSFKNDGSL
jgi:hypothetical protein